MLISDMFPDGRSRMFFNALLSACEAASHIAITLLFKDQRSANSVRRQLGELLFNIIFISQAGSWIFLNDRGGHQKHIMGVRVGPGNCFCIKNILFSTPYSTSDLSTLSQRRLLNRLMYLNEKLLLGKVPPPRNYDSWIAEQNKYESCQPSMKHPSDVVITITLNISQEADSSSCILHVLHQKVSTVCNRNWHFY